MGAVEEAPRAPRRRRPGRPVGPAPEAPLEAPPAPALLALGQSLQLRREALIQQARTAAQPGATIEVSQALGALATEYLTEVRSHYRRMPLADAELTVSCLRGCNQ